MRCKVNRPQIPEMVAVPLCLEVKYILNPEAGVVKDLLLLQGGFDDWSDIFLC
jgi:hypothetical protein